MIPTGTVTFLFTEIEDSVRLAQEHPEKIHPALLKHHAILQEAITSNKGHIFEITGSAFCSSFSDPEDAINAAKEIQLNIQNKDWEGMDVKIKIGMHSGNVTVNGGKYVGYIVLARAHRVMSAANGGQVLFTQATHDLLHGRQSSLILIRDLGERRLKDLVSPEHLYQMVWEDLRSDFPPVKTLDARPNNFPVQLTSFIGREKQMSEIKNLLSGTRLLTLLGSGGTGKTRLALQVGADIIDEFRDGVWFVELASLKDPQYVYNEIASALKLNAGNSPDPSRSVLDYLRGKKVLLILDNCEHLIDETALAAENILRHCEDVKILATSREEMNSDGETSYRVPSLTLPHKDTVFDSETLSRFEAVRLFIERALLIKDDFKVTNENAPALALLCFRLDGIPLAIELAAARINVLSIERILEKLDNMLNLLTGGKRTSIPRQKTLRALTDWSYDLLSEKEKLLWQRLSVFSGGWNFEAAKEICAYDGIDENEILDLLSNLIGKSILNVNEDFPEVRYNMLETIRQYGVEKQTDSKTIHQRHADYFCKFGQGWRQKLNEEWDKEKFEMFESEHDNFRSAINWCIENNPPEAMEIMLTFGKFLELRAYFLEGVKSYMNVFNANPDAGTKIRGNILLGAGHCATMLGEYEMAEKYLKEGLNIFEDSEENLELANYYNSFGLLNYYIGKFDEAKFYYEKSLGICMENDMKIQAANAISNLAALIQSQGDYDLAMEHYKKALAIYKEFNQIHSIPRILANMSTLEHYSGNYEKAIILYQECVNKFSELGDNDGLAATKLNIGNAYFILKDFVNAEKYYEESLSISKNFGYKNLIANAEIRLGDIALTKDETEKAMQIYRGCISRLDKTDELHNLANCFRGLGLVYFKIGDARAATKMLAVYRSIFQRIGLQLQKAKIEELETKIRQLKSILGESEFTILWTQGSELEIEEAVGSLPEERK